MFYQQSIEVLTSFQPLNDEETSAFIEKVHFQWITKNKLLLQEDETCDRLWFINRGLVRGYYLKKEKELTSWFASENQFFCTAESFTYQIPSYELIEALEDCELVYILRDDLYELYEKYPGINNLGRLFAERHRLLNQRLLRDMRLTTAQERVMIFAQNYRSLFLRIPQKYIASHIGVSEGYVSELLGKIRV